MNKPLTRTEQEELRRQKAKEKSEEFYRTYKIPFKYSLEIKEVLSGLSPSSAANGTNRGTVYHIYMQEDFTEKQLKRKKGDFLCVPIKSRWGGNWSGSLGNGDHETNRFGFKNVPTCKKCLLILERYKEASAEENKSENVLTAPADGQDNQ